MLALIAGTGALPEALMAHLPERPLVCAMIGHRPAITPDLTFRIEHLGSFLQTLIARGVTHICMAGAVTRPAIDPAQIDAETLPLVPQIKAAIASGDDGALRAIIAIFEDHGLTVVGAHEIAPDLLPPAGISGRGTVTIDQKQDAVLAEQVLAEMGQADVGQACLVRSGRVLAREGQDGTDAMLSRFAPPDDPVWAPVDAVGDLLASASEWLSGPDGEPADLRGAILFKGPKPDQDRRADLPVIGPQTAALAVRAGLAGIVVTAGGVMVLDREQVVETLTQGGLFLWVRPMGGV